MMFMPFVLFALALAALWKGHGVAGKAAFVAGLAWMAVALKLHLTSSLPLNF